MKSKPDPPAPIVQLDPPLSQTAWSSDFVTQSVEVFFIFLGDGGIRQLRPVHAASLRLGWGPGHQPGELVVQAAGRYGLVPLVVHSTSWRHEADRLVLTYLAVVEPPSSVHPYLADEPIGRTDLARGDALAAPTSIDVDQVVEHGLRHLSWLVRDDPAVNASLAAWRSTLEAYVPEPFRTL